MAIYEVQGPDGSVYEIEGPDDASDDEISAFAEQQFAINAAHQGAVNPTEGMTRGQLFAAGAGRRVAETGRALRQAGAIGADFASSGGIGQGGPIQTPRSDAIKAEIEEARALEAPLMQTGAGQAGDIAGFAGVLAPTALIPGANTLGGSALINAGAMPLVSTGSPQERAQQGVYGLAGGPLGILGGRGAAGLARSSAQGAAADAAQNAVTRAGQREAIAAGRVLPPSEMADSAAGRFWWRMAEGFAGKDAVKQLASQRNQAATNAGIRRQLGIPGQGQIDEAALDAARTPHVAVYEEAGRVSPDAATALANWRTTNDELRALYQIQNRNPTLEGRNAIRQMQQESDGWLGIVEQEAAQRGAPGLGQRLRQARVELGRIGSVERALNEATGDVSARALAKEMDRGVPLQGEMREAARFAKGNKNYAKDSGDTQQPGVSNLNAALSIFAGPVKGAALLGMPYITRNALLSRPVQALAAPGLNPGAWRMAGANALNRAEVERLLLAPAGVVSTNALANR